ncbi:hypothetical protein BDA96_03G399000 [Sorghum bicolor]|uniref:Uncharacterized protein n=2 Tax=Sorghum bicolor TaxID=4558 RepID=A0A921UQD2_SORBI|nr:hypothetical protein BDA96_03G399000 [Sorghum bicolor]OQU87939.1 hypothetical protein SORBI_3003G369800 [Sorghum bicolor]
MSEFLFLSPPARAINQDETPTRRKPLLLAHSTLPLKTGRKERRHGDRPHTAHRPAAHVVVRRLRLRLRGHSKEAHEQVYFVRARSWAKRRERRGGPSGLFGSNQVCRKAASKPPRPPTTEGWRHDGGRSSIAVAGPCCFADGFDQGWRQGVCRRCKGGLHNKAMMQCQFSRDKGGRLAVPTARNCWDRTLVLKQKNKESASKALNDWET